MRSLAQFTVGYVVGRLAILAALVVIGLLIASAHGTHGPVPAEQMKAAAAQEAVALQDHQEEARQAEYARPGPPAPTAGWQP